MDSNSFKANILLLLTATIWGFAFVAQRVGMDFIGPFTYNALRFVLGSLSLIPLMLITPKRRSQAPHLPPERPPLKTALKFGILAGIILFLGASLQQAGLAYTTAGKAGFITGLYVVLVPLMGLFWKQRPESGIWLGAFLSAAGLYLLSVTESFTIAFGDLLELLGAFFWTAHVLILGWLSPKIDAIRLSFFQFMTCALLSLITAFILEPISMASIFQAAIPILYGGIGSVGIAYTLQVIAQKDAKPAHAAIILSMECPFAALGGWLILNETMSIRGFSGCALMLSGMLISQLYPYFSRSTSKIQSSETAV